MSRIERREFLQGSAAAVLAGGVVSSIAKGDANDRLRVAILGVNGRGGSHAESLSKLKDKNVEVAVLCDPDRKVLEKKQADWEKKFGFKAEIETDLQKVFDRKDIDAVTVATPNHWHALATIWACQALKDVYVEKPGSHNVREGRKMIEAADKYKRIVQHGVQLRSSPVIQEAVQHLRNGLIGDVYMARGLVYRWRPSVGNKPDSTAPDTLNWNLWQGPAQERQFSERYVHYNWHWHWDYGNGDVGNQGVHQTDMCLWGLGVGMPSEIMAMGSKFLFKGDDKETPELLTSSYFFPEVNKMIEFEVRPWITNPEGPPKEKTGLNLTGNIFYGSKGYLMVKGYNSYESFLGEKQEPGPKNSGKGPEVAHVENWIDAIRSRKAETLNGNLETCHTSSSLAHLGNIAYRTGRRLKFDVKTEKFINDAEADTMLTREYRSPFVVPETV